MTDRARTGLVITGVGVVAPTAAACVDDRPLPRPVSFVAQGFDPVARLGRKTARFNSRTTLLALAACDSALADAGITVTDETRDGIGVTLGTTCGSLTGTVEFGWDTFAEERPYLVNAATFPNSVINTAAGAVAIRHGLRGANSTVAAGPLAGIAALRHAAVTLHAHHADTILIGAAEECTAPAAWWAAALRPDAVLGEGAAVLVLERADVAAAAGRAPVAAFGSALTVARDVTGAGCAKAVRDALDRAGVEPSAVRTVALRLTGVAEVDDAQRAGVAAVLVVEPETDADTFGDCFSAHAALQLADLACRARSRHWGAGDAGVVLAADPDGAIAVAVLRGVS
ncbi:beta-ketoacyl synthase N-terminal-like domain-containing protein [Actinokineospora sp.]|uniref:beta-ketoacyl synthase N-terminal-like domain-containing protein n=1 Tax=Actinokineospora sp. TaxID=1872133 RepID=UPI004037FB30